MLVVGMVLEGTSYGRYGVPRPVLGTVNISEGLLDRARLDLCHRTSYHHLLFSCTCHNFFLSGLAANTKSSSSYLYHSYRILGMCPIYTDGEELLFSSTAYGVTRNKQHLLGELPEAAGSLPPLKHLRMNNDDTMCRGEDGKEGSPATRSQLALRGTNTEGKIYGDHHNEYHTRNHARVCLVG